MDTITLLLFEQPGAIYWALFFAELICLLILWRRRTRRALIAALVPAALAGIVLLVSTLVVTPRERLRTALEDLRAAVAAGNATAMARLVDDAYADQQYTKAQVVAAVDRHAEQLGIQSVKLSNVELSITDQHAQVSFRAFAHVARSPVGASPLIMKWRLWWVRRDDAWRLTSSRLDSLGSIPVSDVRGAPRGPGR